MQQDRLAYLEGANIWKPKYPSFYDVIYGLAASLAAIVINVLASSIMSLFFGDTAAHIIGFVSTIISFVFDVYRLLVEPPRG